MVLEITTIILIILSVILFLILVLFIFKKAILSHFNNLSQRIIDENVRERERLVDQFQAKGDVIKELVDNIKQELFKSQRRLDETEKERIGQFSNLKTVLEEYKIMTTGLKESTDHLKNILSNNQLRGRYGEEVAEDLLKAIGFVKGENYTANTSQDTTSTRPDFTIHLPDKTKVNIDVKFPLQSLIKFQESEDKVSQDRYLSKFSSDVKQKIKEVSSRDYINPEENTVDFVILFVPNEMIFSFIYDKLYDVWNGAMRKKVIMTGPFSFTAILRTIFQSYKSFKYQENLSGIVKLLRIFEQEYEKYNEELDRLGERIQLVASQYDTLSTTRTKKLSRIVDKIKGEDILPSSEEKKKLEEEN